MSAIHFELFKMTAIIWIYSIHVIPLPICSLSIMTSANDRHYWNIHVIHLPAHSSIATPTPRVRRLSWRPVAPERYLSTEEDPCWWFYHDFYVFTNKKSTSIIEYGDRSPYRWFFSSHCIVNAFTHPITPSEARINSSPPLNPRRCGVDMWDSTMIRLEWHIPNLQGRHQTVLVNGSESRA